ncbi:MAG: hypothetical protein F6J97_24980 [Leptolyngbya sp. SIO4C1]|nr:hypothetical protein [Leptolyngbya sp. SIO4C1]
MSQQTWWGQRLIEVLQRFTQAGRLQRGRRYANRDRIEHFLIESNLVIAKIRGNANPYYGVYQPPTYTTTLEFKAFSIERWQLGVAEITSKASLVSRLMVDEIPEALEANLSSLGISLLPQTASEITTRCTCPDWQNPCKHVAGLYYFLAEQINEDPFILFELRGLPRDALYTELKKSPLGAALVAEREQAQTDPAPVEAYYTPPLTQSPPTVATLQDFWLGTQPLPPVAEPVPGVSAIHIKKQGDNPAFWQQSEPFIAVMEDLYGRVKKYHQGKTL